MADIDHSRGVGVALWRQIQKVIEDEIARGTWTPGDQLPTEFQLAERFGVNRHTVRRALSELEEKGLLRVEQGRGTFVHEHVIDYAVGARTRFTENLGRQSRSAQGRMLGEDTVLASAKVAKALAVPEGSPVVRMLKTGEADGYCISVSDHFFPPRFTGIGAVFEQTGSISACLAHFGVADYVRKSTRVIARMPSTADADTLRQPRNRPVLVTEGLNVDNDGAPVEFGITRWASDWVQVVFEH
ncbi:MAG: phosphonate metabolism transcriptional regulator PhnF [Rhodospirillaceae bacterium]